MAGTKADAGALKEEIAEVLAGMGLRLSPEKTLITHIDEGLDFLGWHIQRHRKRGTGKSYVYVYPAKQGAGRHHGQGQGVVPAEHEPAARCPAHPSQPDAAGLDRVLQVRLSNATFSYLRSYLWKQVIRWQERKHRRTPWKELRRR